MEFWDLIDANREVIGEHIRGEALPDNAYHLVVHVWIKNKNGQYLISQRSENCKSFPLMWETVGGSVLKGESSLHGAIREVKEEVGIDLNPDNGMLAFTQIRKIYNDIVDVWLFNYDGDVVLNNATTDEVAQVKWLSGDDIIRMIDENKIVNTLRYFKDKILCE